MFNLSAYQHLKQECDTHKALLLAVIKDQSEEDVKACLQAGHSYFGENRFQQANLRWKNISSSQYIEKHFIGHLQRNKINSIIKMFDVIQSVDRLSVVKDIVYHSQKQSKKIRCFLQVNIGNELHKSGILVSNIKDALEIWPQEYGLQITGLMAIPPHNQDSFIYFKQMRQLADRFKIEHLSIGMSRDYKKALECGSTMIRIGSLLFEKKK